MVRIIRGFFYRGGQQPIVHLQADLKTVVEFLNRTEILWDFTNSTSSARYASFFKDLKHLDQRDWQAVISKDFTDSAVKEHKQAEFLVYGEFPIEFIELIGVYDRYFQREVTTLLQAYGLFIPVRIQQDWYS